MIKKGQAQNAKLVREFIEKKGMLSTGKTGSDKKGRNREDGYPFLGDPTKASGSTNMCIAWEEIGHRVSVYPHCSSES